MAACGDKLLITVAVAIGEWAFIKFGSGYAQTTTIRVKVGQLDAAYTTFDKSDSGTGSGYFILFTDGVTTKTWNDRGAGFPWQSG